MRRGQPVPSLSRIIHQSGHRFLLVIEEGALRYQLGDHDAMAAQLGYLPTAGAMPTVSARHHPVGHCGTDRLANGVVPRLRRHLVSVELLSARVHVAQPAEIALYVKAFEQLRSMAVYGADARALIVTAIDALR
ncbi:Scr1 family TA system antitoxin-like transcriptional regulator [Streptomyces sp. NPDC059904]|uniref:Scr1 family TA system antitoxin-like transcriptional regulator n=1 Tax=Streptomyces sp. NPDC059904 TaxID=3346996 RepID=UPI00365D6AAB